MAMKTVKLVKEAEEKAADTERDARIKRDEIISRAQEKSKDIMTTMANEALQNAEKAFELADKDHEAIIQKAVKDSENEIGMLKEISRNKEQIAIQLVLSKII